MAYGAALSLGGPGSSRRVVLCALLFGLGRLLFLLGYHRGAAARAFGFGLSFYPTVGLYLVSLKGIALTMVRALAAP